MRIAHDVPLGPLTSLGIGGSASELVDVEDVGELTQVLDDATRRGRRVLVLGGGSNLVVDDAGFDGVVIRLAMTRIQVRPGPDRDVVSAFAGAGWDDFVTRMVDEHRVGVECLAGIPGLVGATPIQNVGAYGQEVADTIALVRAWDRSTGELVTLDRDACGFGYRTSRFKGSDRFVVIEVRFVLERGELSAPIRYPELARALGVAEGDRAPLAAVRAKVVELRRAKGMVLDPDDPDSRSAGSFFVNPIVDEATASELGRRVPGVAVPRFPAPGGKVKLSAGWLIERAGFARGHTAGTVGISGKHALALINRGGATSAALLALAREIQDRVRDRLGIELVPEPVLVGTALPAPRTT